MSVWGKLSGGGIGLAIGGPIGALIGAFAGHYLVDKDGGVFAPPPPDVVLTTGLVALAAKMARADGVVARSEIEAFTRIVSVSPREWAGVERLFQIAQATTDGFQAYAAQLSRTFADEPALLDDVLDGLFMIAKADGAVHEAELDYLREVARIFGKVDGSFDALLARHVEVPNDAYRVLGADRSMTFDELKSRYRRLVGDMHPDREIARGRPPEAIRIATDRLAIVNAAWDTIEREHRPS